MLTGVVKWFNSTKGYGFIKPDNGGSDVFVHATALPEGRRELAEGQRVGFELATQRGKTSAIDLKVL